MSERKQSERLYQTIGEEQTIIRLLTSILERQDSFIDRIGEMEAKLDGHMGREEGLINQFVQALPSKPDGRPDIDGHRDYHTTLIEEGKARAQFFRELRIDLAKKGLWSLLGVLTFLVIYWWNGEVKK